MAWSLREKVRGVNEGERERELGEGSQVMEGRADGWGRGETWRANSTCVTRIGDVLADRPRVRRGLSVGRVTWQ